MGIFKLGSIRRKKPSKPEANNDNSKDETAADLLEEPKHKSVTTLPSAPSATELLLRSDTKTAKTSYQRAQAAEKRYRAKKDAERARQDYTASCKHLRSSCSEFGLGVKAALRAAGSSSAIVKEHQNSTASKADARKKERQLERQKKLDARMKKMEEKREKIAKEKAEAEAEAAAGEKPESDAIAEPEAEEAPTK